MLARCASGRVGKDLQASYPSLNYDEEESPSLWGMKSSTQEGYAAEAVQSETGPQKPIILIVGISS